MSLAEVRADVAVIDELLRDIAKRADVPGGNDGRGLLMAAR